MPLSRSALAATAALLGATVLSACASDTKESATTSTPAPSSSATSSGTTIAVAATDTTCALDKSSVDAAGPAVLNVHNGGTKVTEVYVLKDNATSIVTERENIAPNSDAQVTVELPSGALTVSCRPADAERINTPLTVGGATSSATPQSSDAAGAISAYREYITAQVADCLDQVQKFADAIKANDLTKAKSLFAPSRVGWEAIEPVAEAFGDIDPKTDTREADLQSGETWTGWHRIEKSLWVDNTTTGMGQQADDLVSEIKILQSRIPTAELTVTSMANGAKELLDEVASGKITGEEDTFSHTDLWDFKANVDGAEKVFDLLKPIAQNKDAALVSQLDSAFSAVQAELAKYTDGAGGYKDYSTVTEDQRKTFSNLVNALAEPLSKLAAAVVQ